MNSRDDDAIFSKLLNFRLKVSLPFHSNAPDTEEREEGVAWGNYRSLPKNETGIMITSGPKQVTRTRVSFE